MNSFSPKTRCLLIALLGFSFICGPGRDAFAEPTASLPCPKPEIQQVGGGSSPTPPASAQIPGGEDGPSLRPLVIQAWPCEESKDDGYWTWLPLYVLENELFQRRVDEVRKDLENMAEDTDSKRGTWMKRLRLELEYDESPDAEGVRMDKIVLQQNRVKRNELKKEIDKNKAEQRKLIDEVMGMHASLLANARKQNEKNGDHRPGLADEAKRLEDQEWFLKVELYDAAKWHNEGELLKLMKEFDFTRYEVPSLALWYRARARLADASNLDRRIWLQQTSPRRGPPDMPVIMAARTQRLEALSDLRRLVRYNPNHHQAKAAIRGLELYWLKQAMAKIDREKNMSLDAFGKYLTERGFNKEDKYGWWDGTKQFFATYFGLGPISLTAGLPGIDVPGALADSVGIIQMSAVKNTIALTVMTRLVKNGIPLTEMKKITPEQLAKTIVINTKTKSISPQKARRMWREIKEAFAELKVLNALASDDPFYFAEDVNDALAESVYIPIDSEYHWYEYFGDLMSLRNIAAFWAPNTILTKVNGKWLPWLVSPNKVSALEQAGKWVTVRSKVSSFLAPRLASLSEKMARNRVIGYMAKRMAASPNLIQGLEKMGEQGIKSEWMAARALHWLGVTGAKRSLQGTKLAAMVLLWGGAHHLAYESGIPGAVLLVDLILEFEVPQQFLGAFKQTGVELSQVALRLEEVAAQAARRQAEIRIANEAMDDIMELGRKLRSGEPAVVAGRSTSRSAIETAETVSGSATSRSAIETAETVSGSATSRSAIETAETVSGSATSRSARESAETVSGSAPSRSARDAAETVSGSAGSHVDEFGETVSAVSPNARTVSNIDEFAETISAGPGAANHIPQNVDEAIDHAMTHSATALKSGDVAELERAATAAKSMNKTALERAETISQKVSKADDIVSEALVIESGARAPGRAAGGGGAAGLEAGAGAGAPGRGLSGATIAQDSNKALQPFFDPNHYTGNSGSLVRKADAALYADDLEEALAHYRKAKHMELALGGSSAGRLAYLEEKIALILNGQRSRKMFEAARAAAAETAAKTPISKVEQEWVLEQFRTGNFKQVSGGRNPLFEVTDESGNRFLVKKLENLDELEAEVAVPVLANALGLNAPAARGLRGTGVEIPVERTVMRGGREVARTGQETIEFAVIMRPVDDFIELGAMNEHHLLAMRKDYAAQRTLKSWVADSDGHRRNILFDKNGKMWIIDHDMGNVTSSTLRQAGGVKYTNDPEALIEGAITFAQGKIPTSATDDVVAEMWRASRGDLIKNSPLYSAMKRHDQLIRYEDMAPIVEKIKGLHLEGSIKQRLIEAGFSEGRAHAIVTELGKRRGALERTLNSEKLFGGTGPMQLGQLMNLLDRWGYELALRERNPQIPSLTDSCVWEEAA